MNMHSRKASLGAGGGAPTAHRTTCAMTQPRVQRKSAKYPPPAMKTMRWHRLLAFAAALLLAVLYAFNPAALRAQGLTPKRVPGLNKIESSGATKGIFTGGVQLLDLHSKVLEVSSADGANTAIFPIGKKVKVASIEGRKLKLAALTPGTNVIVHYQQEGGRRTVQQITIVKKAPAASKKPSAGR